MRRSEFVKRLRDRRLMLPPLSGYTDHPYRIVMAKFSPPFICTEMLSPQAIIRGNPKTMRMLKRTEGAHLNGVQLVGDDLAAMGEAARVVEALDFDYVDINMGCTVKSITRNGAGVSLMKSEEKAYDIATAVTAAVDIPVTCKIRLGAAGGSRNAVSLSRRLMDAGVTAITVHGRSGEKKFGLPVDFTGLKEVVDNLAILVVANGGVFTGRDALEMIQRTGAAAVMPGRGLIGNPWLITEILSTLSGASYSPPSLDEKKEVCLMHLRHLCDFYGERKGLIMMRRILPKYFSGCRYINALRKEDQRAASFGEVQALLDRLHGDGPFVSYGDA